MNNEHDEDLRKARLYLTLDADEMQNVKAEHAKWEAKQSARRQAMLYGDSGSPQKSDHAGPLYFVAVCCRLCGVKLTSQNHALAMVCGRCHDRNSRLAQNAADAARFEEKRLALNKLRASRPSVLKQTLGWCAVAAVLAVGFAWIASKAAWALGGGR